ncbi:peptidylprolyl isomerase SurA [Pantoea sp. Mhis]|uniref:peptidylprolyl isomerase SurA n=1 Tax=Pantoea sp. Mhis TaxID=2576759 RepID=UPI00135C0E2C|nr:peptidylprolyl isomerase SurA [Pantoea sp. Mhis]MXP56480.1 peptidylprolyl isomerase SurA [Pantoea sp. Mhis]
MKNWRILIFSTIIIANIAFGSPLPIDKIAAIVNQDIILESSITQIIHNLNLHLYKSSHQFIDKKKLYDQILEQQIMNNIILQINKNTDLNVSEEELDETIQHIAATNHITLNQLHTIIVNRGINYQDYRDQIRKEIMIEVICNNEVRRRITILPQEVETLVTQLRIQNNQDIQLNISSILIPLPISATKQQFNVQKKLADHLIFKLKDGSDFNKITAQYSANADKFRSYNIGWNKIKDLPDILAQNLYSVKKNDIIGPIVSDSGFYILKINDVRKKNEKKIITEVHVRHILLKTSPIFTNEEARSKLKQIIKNIKNNKITFAKAAKDFSDDISSSEQGGDLGWTALDIYDSMFRNVLLKLHKGQISQPIYSSLGWHLIQLIDNRQVDKTDEMEKELAYNLIFNKKYSEEMQSWMQEQRNNSYIKILS